MSPQSRGEKQSLDIDAKVFEMEEKLQVAKNDRGEYEILTQLQWFYVLTICARGIISNKKQWAIDNDMDESYVYRMNANHKVAKAVTVLGSAKAEIRVQELDDVAFKRALEGDAKWGKLLYDRYRPVKAEDTTITEKRTIKFNLRDKQTPNPVEDSPPTQPKPN